MKKPVKIALIAIIALTALSIAFLAWMGLFGSVKVTTVTMGPITYAYEPFTGPYHKTLPAFEAAYAKLSGINMNVTRGIGVYYDNPDEVAAEKLRSECGSIIEEKDLGRIGDVKNVIAVKTIPAGEYLRAEFPIRNMLSYMIGPMKVYPAIGAELKRLNAPSQPGIEIYDMDAKKTIYLMRITPRQ